MRFVINRHLQIKQSLTGAWFPGRENPIDLSQLLELRQISAETHRGMGADKQAILERHVGLALISRRGTKTVALNRLVNGELKGWIVHDPMVYAALEQQFWHSWTASTELCPDNRHRQQLPMLG